MLVVTVRLLIFALLAGMFVGGIAYAQANNVVNLNANNASGPPIVTDGLVFKPGNSDVTLTTTVQAGLLEIRSGTLLMGADNRISDGTPIELNGGTLNMNGMSDAVGALTLTQDSVIDFGISGNSILTFANSSTAIWGSGATLTIANWNPGDQLIFGSLSEAQQSQIFFLNPGGMTGLFNARILPNGEIVPVPEPATVAFGALLLGSVGYRERKRLAGFARNLRQKFSAS